MRHDEVICRYYRFIAIQRPPLHVEQWMCILVMNMVASDRKPPFLGTSQPYLDKDCEARDAMDFNQWSINCFLKARVDFHAPSTLAWAILM